MVALTLIIWLALSALEQTTLTADLERREVSTETTLGNLRCRKELKLSFPFFVLGCQDAQEP